MLQLYRFFRDEKGLEKTDIYYQAHVTSKSIFFQNYVTILPLARVIIYWFTMNQFSGGI